MFENALPLSCRAAGATRTCFTPRQHGWPVWGKLVENHADFDNVPGNEIEFIPIPAPKESSRFLEKAAQKLLLFWACSAETARPKG